jgi:hypothetical protein
MGPDRRLRPLLHPVQEEPGRGVGYPMSLEHLIALGSRKPHHLIPSVIGTRSKMVGALVALSFSSRSLGESSPISLLQSPVA